MAVTCTWYDVIF